MSKDISTEKLKSGSLEVICGPMFAGKPASYHDPVILPGDSQTYQARCRPCFSIDKKPEFNL